MSALDPSQCESIDRLAEEFVQRYRRGERPPLKEYLDKYPHLADDIRTLFPALVEMEQIKEDQDDAAAVAEAPPLRQVGDYRIIREVGRGGMGVVYEAEQVSLGRRVAVKVLPPHIAADHQSLERFRREAKSAAKLHHTNIVPVFEVGQDGDVCYYAMQFIQGQSLDQIIVELDRLHRGVPGRSRAGSVSYGLSPVADASGSPARADDSRPAIDRLAQSLLTGRFQVDQAAAIADETRTHVFAPEAVDVAHASRGADATPLADSSSWAVLPGQADLSSVQTDRLHYFQSVARIGWQTATALAHAHARGIIHRDIKPSNLLLDSAGVVWITDFGLAKTQDVALTTTGDVVGTLRYMAPERLKGEGDERGDVYALGLTLYEMLVLRPAFAGRDRLQLVDRIKNAQPARPRARNRRIPRDLETIVLKAIDKEAKQRNPSAETMAEDLRRFLAAEPIQARRTSGLKRLRLWSRRNPALAALLLVLALVAAGASTAAFHLGAAQKRAKEGQQRAIAAERKARRHEADALVGQAHGTRLSRRPGQRFEALDALGKAAAIGHELELPAQWFDRLRHEAIAALALPDIHITQEFDGYPPGTVGVDLSDDFELYVRSTDKGLCTIHRVADNVEIARLPELGNRVDARFGPGRLVAVHWSHAHFALWDLSGAEPVLRFQRERIAPGSFRADGRHLALPDVDDRSILVCDTATGQSVYHLAAKEIVNDLRVALHPSEPFVACFSYLHHPVLVRDLRNGEVVGRADPPWPGGSGGCAWSPDGRTLAVPCGDRGDIQLYAFDAAAPALRPLPIIHGPNDGGQWLSYSPAGDRFVIRGWNGAVHLFDALCGQRLFSTHSLPKANEGYPRFDRTGQRLAAARMGNRQERVGLRSVADGRDYRALVHSSSGVDVCRRPAIHPGGRLAAIGQDDGIILFDLQTGTVAAKLPSRHAADANAAIAFDGVGNLFGADLVGFFRWPVRNDPANPDRLLIGPPKLLPLHRGSKGISASRDGRVIAQAVWGGGYMAPYAGGWILRSDSPKPRWVRAGVGMGECSVSPDGRWAAFSLDASVFDTLSGKCVWQLPASAGARFCRFSPDGRWLATDGDGGRVYAAGTWQPGPQLGPGIPWDISPDGTLAVAGQTNGIYRLVELTNGRELARLEDPDQTSGAAAFSADGTKVVVAAKNGLRVWDLRRIRAALAELGLDWDSPPLPPAPPSSAHPLSIQIDKGNYEQLAEAISLLGQSNLHIRAHKFAEAVDALRKAVQADPNSAAAQNNLAWMLLTGPKELRDPVLALTAARKAVELAPEESMYLNTLGVALYRNGGFADAIGVLEQSLGESNGKTDAFDLFFLAMCHHRLGAAAKAKDCHERGKQWLDKHKRKLAAGWNKELAGFQSEAESVLAHPPGQAKK